MPQSFDVIVLGVGGMGSAACFELARRGLRVLGLEQFALAHDRGSSHGHTRIIRTAYAEGPAYVPLAKRAFSRWYELEQLTGQHLLTECACLNAGPPQSEHVEGVRKSVREHNLVAEELNASEINRRFPAFRLPENYTGIIEQAAGFLYVEESVRAHCDIASSLSATIRASEPVREWKVIGDSVEVTSDRDTYLAAKLIVTAGAWATKLLADIGVPLRVMRQVLTWFDVGGRADFRRDRFPIFIADVPAEQPRNAAFRRDRLRVPAGPFYGLPAIDHFGLKAARHYHAPELPNPDGVNWNTTPDDAAPVREFLDAFIPGVGALTKSQVCMYTITPDHHFVIDLHPHFPQVSVACGFSGHGFKFASVVGEILADLSMQGKTPHDISLFSAKRNLGERGA